MKNLILAFFLLSISECRVDFDYSSLFDMYDFKGNYDTHIDMCDHGCRVYLTYPNIPPANLGDGYNAKFAIQLDGVDIISFYDLNHLTLANGEKGFVQIPSGKSFNVHNPNGNAAAWPLAFWVVKNSAPMLESLVVFDVSEQKHIETSSSRVVLMGVTPFTAKANLIGDHLLTVKTAPFDMLGSQNCEYVAQILVDGNPSFSLPFNSPIVSFGFDATQVKMTLDIQQSYLYDRDMGAFGYMASSGYIGCNNRSIVFRSDSYNEDPFSFNQTFVIEGKSKQRVSFYGDLNIDSKAPIYLHNLDTNDKPISIIGKQVDQTNHWEYAMDTSKFAITWEEEWFDRTGSYMIRYDVSSDTSSQLDKTTTSLDGITSMAFSLMSTLMDKKVEGFHTIYVYDRSFNTFSFTVPRRYTNLQFINAGTQGTVVSADDSVSRKRVAIKKMHQPFVMPMSAKRAYREFVLLSSVKHSNIVPTYSVFTPQQSKENFRDVYLVMELLDHTLSTVVSRNVTLDHMKLSFFIYQILCAVNHLHREGIIHRDLKPSNIGVNENCVTKVLDFGLARLISPSIGDRMTTYVTTRYYRAPEVVLGLPYSEKADVWSIGCIFAELITRRVTFQGKDKVTQWNEIVKIMGTPSEQYISQLTGPILDYVTSLPIAKQCSIEEIIPDRHFLANTEHADLHLTADDARRLISKMLRMDPMERYSVAEALHDPYVRKWFREDEVKAPLSRNRFNWDLADVEQSLTKLNSLIFDEVKRFESSHDVFGEVSS